VVVHVWGYIDKFGQPIPRTFDCWSVPYNRPLLLASKRVLPDSQFESLLRACSMISFRYNVIGSQPTSEQERVYNAVAEKVSRNQIADSTGIVRALAAIYPSDEAFRSAFAEKILRTTQTRNKRVVRYILCELEKRLSNVELDFDSDSFNVEHVLPENPETGWDAFSEDELDALVFRLGNMTLLASGPNRDIGNAAYVIKRPVFTGSGFEITRKLAADNADWNPERVAARQNWMATQATTIWRIDALS